VFNGIINVYKEKGFTSHDVVAKLRGILKQKKIGHTGTLDPDATGVLPVCLGKATKLCDMLTDKDKTYEAVLLLGQTTDTEDVTGTVLTKNEVNVTEEEVLTVIKEFIGEYDQVPPMYSALKVNGKKLYELAREGIEIERKPRKVYIHNIDILEMNLSENEVKMLVSCSKGTYIRSLCRDIGERLSCGGCMKSLIRTKVSRFHIEDSLTLSEIEELIKEDKIESNIVQIEDMFTEYEKIFVEEKFNRLIYNGNGFHISNIMNYNDKNLTDYVRVYDSEGLFIGIYEYQRDEELFKSRKMFI
jgi:tRNA pseudouridine55 synthase